jgi:hypothetical protein
MLGVRAKKGNELGPDGDWILEAEGLTGLAGTMSRRILLKTACSCPVRGFMRADSVENTFESKVEGAAGFLSECA